jgi:hypothetical protein
MPLPPAPTRGFTERLGVKPVGDRCRHDMMVVKPEEVARVLLQIA